MIETKLLSKTNWQKVKLDKIADVNMRSIDSNYPYREINYIDISSVGSGKLFSTNKLELREAPGRAKRLVFDGDTILSTVRPNRRSFLYIKNQKNNTIVSTGFAVISPKAETDSRFLYYLVTRQQFTDYLESNIKGSAYPAVSPDVIENAEVLAPPFNEQKRIASILSAFDDKIELNNKISKNLEKTAQVIFKEWFVNFKFPGHEKVKMVDSELGKIPEGWGVKKFGELLKLKHGHGYKSEEFSDERTNRVLVRMGNFKEIGGLQFDGNTKYLKSDVYNKKDQLIPNDLVMVLSDITRDGRIIGSVGLIPDDNHIYLLNQRVAKIETEEKFKLFLFFYFNSKKFKEHCLSRADSATVLNLKSDHIYEIKMAVPDDNILDKFNALVLPIFRKSREIENENQKLAVLRDLLLPKLMSGEIKVK